MVGSHDIGYLSMRASICCGFIGLANGTLCWWSVILDGCLLGHVSIHGYYHSLEKILPVLDKQARISLIDAIKNGFDGASIRCGDYDSKLVCLAHTTNLNLIVLLATTPSRVSTVRRSDSCFF